MELRRRERRQSPIIRWLARQRLGRHLWITVLPLLIAGAILILTATYFIQRNASAALQEDVEHISEDAGSSIVAPLSSIPGEVSFFSNFLKNQERYTNFESAVQLATINTISQKRSYIRQLNEGVRTFVQNQPEYTYVAILDADGEELIRVERDASTNRVDIFADEALRDQFDTNYVQEARQLRQGLIWVSPIELRRDPTTNIILTGNIPTVRLVTSLYDADGRRISIVVYQINLAVVLEQINTFEGANDNSQLFMLDSAGYYIAHNSQPDLLYGRELEGVEQTDQALTREILTGENIPSLDLEIDGTTYWASTAVIQPFSGISGSTIANPPSWTIVFAEERSLFPGNTLTALFLTSIIVLIATILTFGVQRIQRGVLNENINVLSSGMNRISIGDLTSRVPDLGEAEFGGLAESFNRSAATIQTLIRDLESSVQARIRDLDITGEISREVAGLRDVNLVMSRAINLITERFDFYHAQVFLVDDLHEFAVLVASTGDAGRRLLAKNHKLGVGTQSVIGRVTSLGVTVIAGDTQTTDVPWRPNVELPETRAEMALPLKVEDIVIGALDIQSTAPDAFTPSDIEVFQVLADQLAIAINNANLLEESSERIAEVDQLNRRLTERSWQEFASRRPHESNVAYSYDLMEVKSASPDADNAIAHRVPISIRGIEVGSIQSDKENLSDEERALLQAVATRVSLAIDNARLFQETQFTLADSQRLYETARTVSASADLEIAAIYKLVVDQLIYQETLDQVAVLIAEPIPSPRASRLDVDYVWVREALKMPWNKGDHLDLLQQGLGEYFQVLPRNALQTRMLNTMGPMDPGRDTLLELQTLFNANSMLIIPLTTGVKWFGVILLAGHGDGAFDNSFGNFAAAVADQLAIAIENRRLLEQVQDEARRSLALAEAGQLVSQIGGDFADGVNRLFNSISGPGNYDRWWFGLIEGRDLRAVSVHATDGNELPHSFTMSNQSNAITAALALRQVILVNDLEQDHPLLGDMSASQIAIFGKHLAIPVMIGQSVMGALLLGRSPNKVDLDERDIQLITTLASQLAVATQNQTLFESIQQQQETIRTTLETMPAGVILLDQDGQILLTNQRSLEMLGLGLRDGFFARDTYPLYYVDSDDPYTREDFPLTMVLEHSALAVSENITVERPDGTRMDILLSARPVRDDDGNLTSAVAVLQEITELRELEKALQASLGETTVLYEASRTLLAAGTTQELYPAIINQMGNLRADELYLIVEPSDDLAMLPPNVLISEPPLPVDDPMVSDIPLPTELLMTQSQLVIENMNNISHLDLNPEVGIAALQAGIQALVTTPLIARGKTLGWLVIGYGQPRNFLPEDRRFINSLADQTAVSLESIRLFESTERALQSVASLYQSSRRVAEAQGVREVIEITQEELTNFDPDRIDLLLQRSAEDTENMYFAIAWSKESSLENVPSLPVHPDSAQPLADFDLFNRNEYYIENFLNEVGTSDLHEALYQLDTPYQGILSIPLRVGGRTIGRIGMGFLKPRRYSSDDRQLVNTLADATGYVVENDLLLGQTQESLEETGVLYQASRTIANAEHREEIIEALIDYAASAQVDKTMLVTLLSPSWESDGAVIEITSTWGSEEVSSLEGLYFTRDQFPIWEQLSTPEIVWFDDIENNMDISDNARMGYQALGIASVAIVPLGTPTGIIGCVLLGSSTPRRHEGREIRIYQALADQAAVQLENKRLFEQTEFRARQLSTSAEVSRAVTSILDLNELFPRVVDLIFNAFDYDHVQIFMIDDEGERAVVRASTGEAGRQLLAIKHSLPIGSDSVIGRVTSKGEPTIALDTTDPEAVHRPNPYLPETRSEMALPLFVQGRVVGALDVQSKRPQAFGADDIQALTPLVDQLAVAIENARLFEVSEQRAEEMRFMFNVTTAAASESDLIKSLDTVGRILADDLNATAVNTFLYEPLSQTLVSQVEIQRDRANNETRVTGGQSKVILEMGQGLVGTVAQTREPILVLDLQTDARYFDAISSSRSGIYAPLMAGPELIGVLAVESDRRGQFDQNDLQLLQTLATSIAAVIRTNQLLEEVQETNDRLREVDQLKTNFLAAMSHELRTPLNSIIGFSRVILKGIDGPLTEMQQQDIQTIHDSGKHLLGLVNDILDQAKIEAGKMELVLDYFDVPVVINSVMASAIGLTEGKEVRLYTEIEEGLPLGFGDEFRTRQILFNLISNAAKFTTKGSITVEAKVARPEDGIPYLQIGVTDTGIGIAEKDYGLLFESFQQVDNSTTRSVEGTGLGLPLSRSLARLQNGELWLTSEVGVGSTFYVSVPLQPEGVEYVEPEPEPVKNGHGMPTPGMVDLQSYAADRTILAVDDDEEVISLYRRYLSREGWNVVGITQPEGVEAKITETHARIILLDINMPNRTGWQILESLKGNPSTSQIPVIICSIDDNKARSEDLGAVDHLMKPFIESDLVKAVRAAYDPTKI